MNFEDFGKYYRLKNQYEVNWTKQKKKILSNDDLSKREKRARLKLLKPKCIVCKNPGGTIFSVTYDEEENSRILSAKCGNTETPCAMNIRISAGRYLSVRDMMVDQESKLVNFKRNIILDKNNLLFGFSTQDEVLERFEEMKNEITSATTLLHEYIRVYNDITEDKDNMAQLSELTTDAFAIIKSMKECISNFETSQNTQFIRDAVSMNINDLAPKLSEIMQLKYKQTSIFFNEDDGTYHLNQEMRTIESTEYDLVEPHVISYTLQNESA